MIVTSKDENLTKGHVRYLESRLIGLAKRAARVELENSTQPPPAPLPEADRYDMEYFIEQVQVVLPVLGVNAIRVREVNPPDQGTVDEQISPLFRLVNAKQGVDAKAQQIDGEFTMLAGSTVVGNVRQSARYSPSTARAYASCSALHAKLVASGTITVVNGTGRVTRNVVFSSPSTAGAIALGRSCNGRAAWISTEGETFGTWESRGVE